MPKGTPGSTEYTVDELASRAGMTVRNVRAYAGRGLIDAPRLQGRTGYYTLHHLQRLQLIRELLDRGYTLAAVEKAILNSPSTAAGNALDLLDLLGRPNDTEEPEVMTRDALAALAGVPRDDGLIDAMAELGLVEWEDDDRVRLLTPTVVRSGAAAASLGLRPETVIGLFPIMSTNLRTVADAFVSRVVDEIVQPFLDAGMAEDEWPHILQAIETLIPVASQATLAMFRDELAASIDEAVGEQLAHITGQSDPHA